MHSHSHFDSTACVTHRLAHTHHISTSLLRFQQLSNFLTPSLKLNIWSREAKIPRIRANHKEFKSFAATKVHLTSWKEGEQTSKLFLSCCTILSNHNVYHFYLRRSPLFPTKTEIASIHPPRPNEPPPSCRLCHLQGYLHSSSLPLGGKCISYS